jgi:hypothetical protein
MVPAYAGTLNAVWTALSALGAMTNPMTTQDDVIVGGAVTGGVAAPARLGKGTDGQVLTVDPTTHHLLWATPKTVATDPLWAAAGDLAVGTGAATATKLTLTVPAANILNALGVVNGETTPTWKSLMDATAPTTQAFGDTAAAGSGTLLARITHKHAMPSDHPLGMMGTAFPTGAALTAYLALYGANAPFYRTNLGEWYYYDGTRWLTGLKWLTIPSDRVGFPSIYPDIYLRRLEWRPYVATTNNGSNYRVLNPYKYDPSLGAPVSLGSLNTSAGSPNVVIASTNLDINAVLGGIVNYPILICQSGTPVGSPGALTTEGLALAWQGIAT